MSIAICVQGICYKRFTEHMQSINYEFTNIFALLILNKSTFIRKDVKIEKGKTNELFFVSQMQWDEMKWNGMGLNVCFILYAMCVAMAWAQNLLLQQIRSTNSKH